MFPNDTNYSANFTRAELDCRCGCATPAPVAINLQNLAVHLEQLRAAVGGPVHINDAYRCLAENTRVGGAPHSQHLQGKAADCDTGTLSTNEFAARAAQVTAFAGGGIGTYPSQHFVHVDYRGYVARWSETTP
jgi:zinc D-Ala-D-Ala carboxypeptidase